MKEVRTSIQLCSASASGH